MNIRSKTTSSSIAAIFVIAIFANSCRVGDERSSHELLTEALTMLSGRNPDWRKARILATRAVRNNQNDVRARLLLAAAYEKNGQINAAVDELKRAVEISPDNFLAQFMLGRLYYESGRFDNALAHLINANRTESRNGTVLYYLARTYHKLRQNKNARVAYLELGNIPEFRRRPEPFNELGVIYLQEGDFNSALKAFVRAYLLDRESYGVIWNLAIFYDFHARNPVAAISFYEKYQQATSTNPELMAKRDMARKRISELNYASMR